MRILFPWWFWFIGGAVAATVFWLLAILAMHIVYGWPRRWKREMTDDIEQLHELLDEQDAELDAMRARPHELGGKSDGDGGDHADASDG